MRYRILLVPALFLLGSLGGGAVTVVAQTSPPPAPQQPPSTAPQPTAPPQITVTSPPRASPGLLPETRTIRSATREVDEAFEQLRALEIRQTEAVLHPIRVAEVTRNVYRKPNKKEMKALAPGAAHLDKYAAFLRQEDTGIMKLVADADCAGGGKINVVVAKENCLPYSVPGGGTSFSFRAETYRFPHLADLVLAGDVMKIDGVLQQGIMVSLGDVPLEEVTLDSKGLKYLTDFQPFTDSDEAVDFDRRLVNGVKENGYLYGIGLYAKPQTTYALRSIAYRGKHVRSIDGVAFNEMDFDKRKDVIVAFRIVEREPSTGDVTVVWKILARKDAPTWKLKKKQDEK